MSPTSHCYFDYYQGDPDVEPLAIGGYLPLIRVYEFEPVPEELSEEEASFILGTQANLWAEYIATPEHAEYMLFPRTAALAEVAWTATDLKDWKNFANRLEGQLERYKAAGINFAESAFDVRFSSAFDRETGRIAVELKTEMPQADIRYTHSGRNPRARSAIYTSPLSIERSTVLKAASFSRRKRISPVRTKEFFLHKAVGKTVSLTYPFAERYSGGGEFALVDGLRGTKNQRDGFWQGYEGVDLEAVIDLEKPVSIGRLSAGFLQNISAWIFLPTQVEFAVSGDGFTFESVAVIPNDISPRTADRVIKLFEASFDPVEARYIRLRAESIGVCPDWHFAAGGKTWLFIDEILIQ
jgi:hexosaminidase